MPIESPTLIAALLEYRLLDSAAEASLPELSLTCATPADLTSELVRRRWLTHFQAELLLAGRAGELVVEKYILLERLGQGGMGAVYKARHRVLKAVRAVKIIHPERLTGPNAVKRFFQEVEAVGKLFHPNIILPHDAGETNGVYWLAMEYVPGADLGRLLDRGGPLPPTDACEYIRQGALALQHAHERGLVHRDIKPANLLVSSADGRVKLLDLGLARVRAVADEDVGPQTALTQAGSMMGTPDYLAPEQAQDSHSVDIRADIYALACTLYHVLAGRPPFAGGSVMEKIIKHRSVEAEALETICGGLPDGLTAVIRKGMAKSPADRYQTPSELASALAPFCANASPAKPRPAGASGEHPILATSRPSLATIPGGPGLQRTSPDVLPPAVPSPSGNRSPTPPGKPTMTAPPGAMPSPGARTTHSLDTHLDPTILPGRVELPRPSPPEPTRRRTRWVPVGLLVVVIGGLIGVGARFLPKHAEPDSPREPPVPHTEIKPVSTAERIAPSEADTPHAPPEPVRPGIAKGNGGLTDGVALARPGSGDYAKAANRPVSFVRRQPLHQFGADPVRAVAFIAGGGRAAVVCGDHFDVYDLAPKVGRLAPVPLGELLPGLEEPSRAPTAIALSADGRHAYLATTAERPGTRKGSLFNAVVHWEYGKSPATLYGPPVEGGGKPELLCVGASTTGSVLAAGVLKSACAVWWNSAASQSDGREFKHLVGDAVAGLAFSPDGKRVLFCGRDQDLCLHTFGVLGGEKPLPFRGHPKGSHCAAFSADGRFAVSGGRDGKLCVWDFDGPAPADGILRPTKELSWHNGEVKSVAFAPSGDRFVTGGEDGYVCVGEAGRSEQVVRERAEAASAQVLAVAFSGDGASAYYATDRSLGRILLRPPTLAEARGPGGGGSAIAKPLSAH
jgi:serine/threonine protein kinase